MAYLIYARKVFTGNGILEDQLITCDNNIVKSIEPFTGQPFSAECDCIAPGLMDIHINGGEQYNFSKSPTIETLKDIEASCFSRGTLFTLPTLVTSPVENVFTAIDTAKAFKKLFPRSGVLGIHLEGPFLHPVKRGAHLKEYLRVPDDDLLKRIIDEGKEVVRMITIAPELFTDHQIDMLLNSGIAISAGHSNATYEQASHAFDRGIRLVTHLFNAMSSFMHRAPGLVGATFDNEKVFAPVIMDGHHCAYGAARVAYKIKQEKFFLISDALFVGGKVKTFEWGNYDATLENGIYVNSEGNLTGAVITMADAVRSAVKELDIPLQEAIEMATLRPALALGIEHSYGMIAEGYPAAFTVFDEALKKISSLKP